MYICTGYYAFPALGSGVSCRSSVSCKSSVSCRNSVSCVKLTKFIVHCLEEACKHCFEEVTNNLCIVFDLAEFSTSCMDYQLIKKLIWLLSKHYPERLGACLILNAPMVFSTICPVIKGWLDENTSSKVFFVSREEDFCKYLIPDILPTDM